MGKSYWHKGEQPVKGFGFLLIRNPGGGIDWTVPDWNCDYSNVEWMYFNESCELIMPEELPEEIGLMWVSEQGRIFKKKPAVRREMKEQDLLAILNIRNRFMNDLTDQRDIARILTKARELLEPLEYVQRQNDQKRSDAKALEGSNQDPWILSG